jgi:cytochrome c oxidase assembly factor CtaG
MTEAQRAEFEQRRLAIMAASIKKDPKHRQYTRKRRLSVLASVLGSVVVFGVVLLLLKSFILALEGHDAYAQLVAPIMDSQPDGGVIALAVAPDPVSTGIAAMLKPLFAAEQGTTVSEGVTVPLNLSDTQD